MSRMWVLRPEVSMNDEAKLAAVAVEAAVVVAVGAGGAAVMRREKAAADLAATAATRHVAHLIEIARNERRAAWRGVAWRGWRAELVLPASWAK